MGDGSAAAHAAGRRTGRASSIWSSAQAQVAAFDGRLARGRRALSPGDRHGAGARTFTARRPATRRISPGPRRSIRDRTPPLPPSAGRWRWSNDRSGGPGDPAAVPRRGGAGAGRARCGGACRSSADAEQRYPESTFVRTVLTPVTRAAVALQQRRTERGDRGARGGRADRARHRRRPGAASTCAARRTCRRRPMRTRFASSARSCSTAASIRSRRWCRWRSSASPARTRATATSTRARRAYDELFAHLEERRTRTSRRSSPPAPSTRG